MSLEQASLVAQIISAVAIIGSLIFVGVQLRQATSAMRNSSSQAHSAIYTGLVSTIIENADFASIWRRGLADPSTLDDEHWQNIDAQVRNFASQPGVQAWWKARRDWHSGAFRTWFESLAVNQDQPLYRLSEEQRTSKHRTPRGSGAGDTKE